jgi:Copine
VTQRCVNTALMYWNYTSDHRITIYSMKILDGDEQRIRNSSGQLASRDLVQFVPMRDFETRGAMALAKEVGDLLSFFNNNDYLRYFRDAI